jgi:hypothetical protein
MRRLLLILSFFLITTSSILSIQKVDLTGIAKEVSSPVPVVFGKKSDGLPEKLQVVGRITSVSFSRACGGVYWSGTIKMELLQMIPNYPYRNVFVVVNCLEDSQNEKEYLNKVVRIELSKLYPELRKFRDPGSFYFELIDNTIDSGGVPFYCTNASRQEILGH